MVKKPSILTVLMILSCTLIVSFFFLIRGYDKVTDVTNNKMLWGGYNHDSIYQLTIDVFLIADTDNQLELSPEKKSTYWRGADVPDSIEEYRNDTKEKGRFNYRHVKGIVEAGTIIKPEILERHVGHSFAGEFDMLYPHARILSGPFKDSLVNIVWISNYNQNNNETPYPCPNILAEVQAGH